MPLPASWPLAASPDQRPAEIPAISAPGSNVTLTGNRGVHCEAQQILVKEDCSDPDDVQGLGAFFQYGWSPEDRNQAHQYIGSGLAYHGWFRGRDADVLGLGVAHLIFSDRMPGQTAETAIELFYKAEVLPRAIFQPDLQYIVRPNGNGRDAFVFGLRFETTR